MAELVRAAGERLIVRVLHVGFGFRPWIVNGLIIYCEDLMDGQVRAGFDVAYFFAGRQVPLLGGPILHRWRRAGVGMYELINSDLVVGRHRGSPFPERDLAHPPTEDAFGRVLQRFKPEVVHIHDLGGLPSSLVGLTRSGGTPVVMTLHDYFSVCPTVKLYDADDRICLRRSPGAMCVVCCADAPTDNREDLERTMWYQRTRVRARVPGLDAALTRPTARRMSDAAIRLADRVGGPAAAARASAGGPPASASMVRGAGAGPGAEAYQRRRDQNVARLNDVDALIAYSRRSVEVFRALGVDGERIRRLRINPAHIESLQPKRRRTVGEPMRFAVLNACNTKQKGGDLVTAALRHLSARGLATSYRLSVRGWVAPHLRDELERNPSVTLDGHYEPGELDTLLESVDVGIVPSVWEEIYGFVGPEFLAKGIPIIASALGGIPEYVRPGETGWLNQSVSASELASLMASAIADPGEVLRLGERAVELRDDFIRPFAAQLRDLELVYAEVLRR